MAVLLHPEQLIGHFIQEPFTAENPPEHVVHLVEFEQTKQFKGHGIQVVEFNRTYPAVQKLH